MIIFSSDIVMVLRLGEDIPHSRRVHFATFRPRFWTLFHHAPTTTLAVRAIPISMIEPSVFALLVPKTAVTQRAPSRFAAASRRAIAIAPIAPRAEKEELAASHGRTDHEAK
jgi:hypothetical protein